jgi:glycosyltransferase involved in cell wall biosynthesis
METVNNQNIILSICIPTYNRSIYLSACLRSIFNQTDLIDSVEVVVSDNCSTDDTADVVHEFKQHKNLHYIRQSENIGMSRNILAVVEQAVGEFCWIIGDDDFIINGSIERLVELIKKNRDVDFYFSKLTGIDLKKYESFERFDTSLYPAKISSDLVTENIEKWEHLISPKYSGIFMGELMAGVFRRSIWNEVKVTPKGEFLSTVEDSYVFCVVYANAFFGRKAVYIRTPIILVLEGVREWMDRLGYILIVIIKDLIELYKSKGLEEKILAECYAEYVKLTIPHAFRYLLHGSDYKDKVSLNVYFNFLWSKPNETLKGTYLYFKSSVKSRLRRGASNVIKYFSPKLHEKLKTKYSKP